MLNQYDDDNVLGEISKAANEKVFLDYKTDLAKTSFIVEMKNGLGPIIKQNPLQVKFIKKPWHVRFGQRLKKIIYNIFTKF